MIRIPVLLGKTNYTASVDFDPGEPQWFDAKAGVGSPGYGPSVTILSLEDDEGNITTLDALEQQCIDYLVDMEADDGPPED